MTFVAVPSVAGDKNQILPGWGEKSIKGVHNLCKEDTG